jgi:murein DD-endopeptidase MepM/ murein hydrolase activator NlpD
MRWPSALAAIGLLLLPVHFPEWMAGGSAAAVPPAPGRVVHGSVVRNASLAQLLGRELSPAAIHALVEAARPVYDLAHISVGRPFGLALRPDGLLAAFTYGIDELRTLRVRRMGPDLRADLVTRTYATELVGVSGVIESSLFATIDALGERDQLALDLAEIFAWDIDFNSEIQRGDSFRVAVERHSLDGRLVRYGRILAAEFVRGERVLRAVRFESERGAGYYAPDGTPLRKAFLRSPLRFTRISSGFSRSRFHPILAERRAHLGIDYAAAAGTPVQASGDGVVVSAGWQGGYGKAVRLRHPNGYETLYGHLSRIAVRPGQRVAQGDLLGSVGQTGLASGPHLDYRMTRNGTFVNPLTAQMPPAEPLRTAEHARFDAERGEALGLLACITPGTHASVRLERPRPSLVSAISPKLAP